MRNINFLWGMFHEKFESAEKECVQMKQSESGKIKRLRVLDRTFLRKLKKYHFQKRYLETKYTKVYQHY